MAYVVTLYNQHAAYWVSAKGRSRPKAFRRALAIAGESFLREGGDKLTTLRCLFYDYAMKHNRASPHCYISDPIGCGVEFRKL